MATILLADDEKDFLDTVEDTLSIANNGITILKAVDGLAATRILEQHLVDLVVTDLNMPNMDGFELMAWMSRKKRSIPVIAMSAYANDKIEEQLSKNNIPFLSKPINYAKFDQMINAALSNSDSTLHGISLPSFLQLLEIERKSCSLKVASAKKHGQFHFRGGMLWAAEAGQLSGIPAAMEMLTWESCKLQIGDICQVARNIEAPLSFVLIESARIYDEEGTETANNFDFSGFDFDNDFMGIKESCPTIKNPGFENIEANISPGVAKPSGKSKEKNMDLDKYLQEVSSINGFKAAAIMTFTGDVLVSKTTDTKIDLNMVGATFNDIFRSAHAAAEKIGLEACRDTVIYSPKGTICMHCTGVKSKAHVHFIGVLEPDGNQALLKMSFQKMENPVMDEIA